VEVEHREILILPTIHNQPATLVLHCQFLDQGFRCLKHVEQESAISLTQVGEGLF